MDLLIDENLFFPLHGVAYTLLPALLALAH